MRQETDRPAMPESERRIEFTEELERDRLHQISDARANIRRLREEAQARYFKGEISRAGVALIYREAVESYLTELRPYRQADKAAESWWSGRDDDLLGALTISPPAEESDKWETADPGQVDAEIANSYASLEPSDPVFVDALDDVLRAPRAYREQFAYRKTYRHHPDEVLVANGSQPLPRHVLTRAVEWANAFAHSVGLDLDVDEHDNGIQV